MFALLWALGSPLEAVHGLKDTRKPWRRLQRRTDNRKPYAHERRFFSSQASMSGSRLWHQEVYGVYSLGSTPTVITSDPDVARDLLSYPHFADQYDLKQSAQLLMFGKAMRFATTSH